MKSRVYIGLALFVLSVVLTVQTYSLSKQIEYQQWVMDRPGILYREAFGAEQQVVRTMPYVARSQNSTVVASTIQRWYAGIDLTDTKSPTSVRADIKAYENSIVLNGNWYHDVIAFAIGIARQLPWGNWETFEVGIIQDGTGMHLYTSKETRGVSETWHGTPNIGQTYSFELRSITNLYWIALIDGIGVESALFSSNVSLDIFSVVQAESGDMANTLKSSFLNIQWKDSSWHNWIRENIRNDGDYYARIFTTYIFDSTILGDSSLDYQIDVLDVSVLSSSWSLPLGPAGYLLYADITHNGAVEMDDLAIMSAHWGKMW